MKRLLLFLFLGLMGTSMTAQRDYDDLLELIVDEKYDRCLTKAEKYTLSDETKKDPLPYLYMSISFFRIHMGDDEKLKEYYENKSFKNSLKYASKYAKKDKENEFYSEFTDYFVELRQATYEEAENYDQEGKYTKSKGLYKYLTTIDPSDPGAWLYKGFTEWAVKSRKDSGLSFEKAKTISNEMGVDHLQEDQVNRFKIGLIMVSEYLDAQGEGTKARELMELGKAFFADDDSYMITYKDIVG